MIEGHVLQASGVVYIYVLLAILMRHFTIIILLFLFGCKRKTVDTNVLTKTIWVNADIKFDTLHSIAKMPATE